jgi:hypothetical protein
VYLHPYNQGFEIGLIEKYLAQKEEDIGKKIFTLFGRKFLDFSWTISFMDGFYRKRPFLKDYADQIEESIILCIQKDFSGAINLLLPVVEGTLRKYLVFKEGGKAKSIVKMSDLLKALDHLKEDYLSINNGYLQKPTVFHREYTEPQRQALLDLNSEYFELWVKQLRDYVKNNLYLDTRKTPFNDTFNRHIILHSLNQEVDYSFANYLRIIGCINFISWALGVTQEGCSILVEIDEIEFRRKNREYIRILIISEAMTDSKSRILGKKLDSFNELLSPEMAGTVSKLSKRIVKVLGPR